MNNDSQSQPQGKAKASILSRTDINSGKEIASADEQLASKTSENSTTERPTSSQQQESESQVDNTNEPQGLFTNDETSSYSDIDSQQSSPRRRRRRGGRKNANHTAGGVPSENLDVQLLEHSDKDEDYDNDQLKKARARSAQSKTRTRPAAAGSRKGNRMKKPGLGNNRTDTGIRSFNLKRAEESGGGGRGARPFGVTLERSKSSKSPKSNSKAAGGRRGGASKSNSEVEGEEHFLEGDVEHEREEGQKQEQDTEKEERKCVSIRLDLNLEVEIFLKMKIAGDVTITFLE